MIKKLPFCVLSGLLVICALAFMPSISSVLFLAVATLLLPITQLQDIFKGVFPRKKIKGLLCAILSVAAIISAPTNDHTSAPEQANPSASQQIIQSGEMEELPQAGGPGTLDPDTLLDDDILPKEDSSIEGSIKPTVSVTETPSTSNDDIQSSTPLVKESNQTTEAEVPLPVNSTFEVHFIDVGQADAALVLCDGHAMLIDGGNSGDSSLIYSYLKKLEITYLDAIVATHGHEDHVGGLSGALNYATVEKAFCSVSNYDSEAFNDFVKYLGRQDKSITVPKVGDTFGLGSANVQVIGVNGNASDHNNSSVVLRIVYGDTSFLFTGDAEREAEQTILNTGYNLESTVLKVGHHGSDSSTSYVFLRAVAPKYGVISVGNGNSYGHPTEDALSRLRDADVTVYRTDLQGTIICTSDGKDVAFSVAKNKDADTLLPPSNSQTAVVGPTSQNQTTQREENNSEATGDASDTDYVGNKNTKKFHYDWCGSVGKMKESNKYYYTGTRDEMIAKGFNPCGNCKP